MKETTQLTDAEYNLYQKLKLSGHHVKPNQICTCAHCGAAYRVCMARGASRKHCGEEACKFAERTAQIKAQNMRRNEGYRIKQQNKIWKHEQRNHRQLRDLVAAQEFSYV